MFTQNTLQNQRLSSLFVNDSTTVKDTLLTYEEYSTLLDQIEVTLNSRPLEPLSDDPEDLTLWIPAEYEDEAMEEKQMPEITMSSNMKIMFIEQFIFVMNTSKASKQSKCKMPFTNEEAVDMIAVYFECFQNASLAQRMYRARYPNRRSRDAGIFPRLVQNLFNSGSFRPQLRRHSARNNEDKIINALAFVRTAPISYRFTSSLKCRRLRPAVRLLSDGQVNLHNMHYWSDSNPHWLREVQHQGRWSLNVWCGILGRNIIGPYFFDQPLNDLTRSDFYLWGRLKDIVYPIPPTTRDDMKIRIQEAIRSLSRAEIEAAVMSTHERLQQCLECNGRQMTFLVSFKNHEFTSLNIENSQINNNKYRLNSVFLSIL
ncbi:hypothetical protein PV328_011802 [Microctonus aethiopoides]|uniref:DUF4817 domain-containing protein n=1 Tax=Microctonus aethiopoides TaxID=144406 RepID=A0AA39FHP9_9HYME|nr:hypothetical protein PV328_011802 [Microctonus aethiopoides]